MTECWATDAKISDCGTFRYTLLRIWQEKGEGRLLVFVMLNPSKADAEINDATINKCISYAKTFGYGGISVVNLYAYRATHPSKLREDGWQIGPENDHEIIGACFNQDVVVAWGAHARHRKARDRAAHVLNLLRRFSNRLFYLELTDDGIPKHPLYLRNDLKLKEFT